jgi:hypothetical protein
MKTQNEIENIYTYALRKHLNAPLSQSDADLICGYLDDLKKDIQSKVAK